MRVFVSALALISVGCATQTETTREATARAQLTHALDMYIAAHPRHPYPAHKEDLASFAKSRGVPLDLSYVTTWQLIAPDTVDVIWKSPVSSDKDRILVFSTNPI
jgi:hypothetical protein